MVNFFFKHLSQFLLQLYGLVIIVNDDNTARSARLPQRKVNEVRKFHDILLKIQEKTPVVGRK